MTCQELTDFLAAYLAGELEPRERAAFEAHLAECPDCIAYVRSYREAIRLAKASAAGADDSAPPMPAELIDAILAATSSRRPR